MRAVKHISKFSITLGLVGFASGLSVQLLSLWFNKMYGVDESTLGSWFAAAEVTSLVVVPIIPKLTRALGSSKSVFAAQGLSAVFLGSMVLSPTYQIAGILYILRNFFMNISWPVQQSYLMGTVPSNERASASAITSMIWGIGNSFGPFLAGIFLTSENYLSISIPLTLGAGVYLASAVAFYVFFRRIQPPEEVAG
jgi:predicted MFS family arabinose efflux permease